MLTIRTSIFMFCIGGVFLLISPLILSRSGQLLFAVIGALFVIFGLYIRGQERRR